MIRFLRGYTIPNCYILIFWNCQAQHLHAFLQVCMCRRFPWNNISQRLHLVLPYSSCHLQLPPRCWSNTYHLSSPHQEKTVQIFMEQTNLHRLPRQTPRDTLTLKAALRSLTDRHKHVFARSKVWNRRDKDVWPALLPVGSVEMTQSQERRYPSVWRDSRMSAFTNNDSKVRKQFTSRTWVASPVDQGFSSMIQRYRKQFTPRTWVAPPVDQGFFAFIRKGPSNIDRKTAYTHALCLCTQPSPFKWFMASWNDHPFKKLTI